jgi:hypothetical protein
MGIIEGAPVWPAGKLPEVGVRGAGGERAPGRGGAWSARQGESQRTRRMKLRASMPLPPTTLAVTLTRKSSSEPDVFS